jgi:hypothetical protein
MDEEVVNNTDDPMEGQQNWSVLVELHCSFDPPPQRPSQPQINLLEEDTLVVLGGKPE